MQTIDPTNTELLAGMISGTASYSQTAVVRNVSYRAPVSVLSSVDAIAAKAGKSRNLIMTLLLKAGIEQVRDKLNDEVAESLMFAEGDALTLLVDGFDATNPENHIEE